MKLIECYIENFGKLSSYTHTFSDGLNVITGQNGCGKTTLSVFIKSMLYGIESKKTKNEDNDRKRYSPWQGGRYGGSLSFESDEKRYRIERTFGDKPSSDVFAIYDIDTGALTDDFSENVGEELFGIDSDGFERTVFLSERKLSVSGNNPTVSAKLSNLVGVDGDMGSFDSAIEELEKKEKYYRHRRGKGGLIGDIKSAISALDVEIMDIARKKDLSSEAEKELSEINKNIENAEKAKASLEEKRLNEAYEKELRAKRENLAVYEKKLENEKTFFKHKLPSDDDINQNEEKKNKARLLLSSLDSSKATIPPTSNVSSDEIQKHISAVNSQNSPENANKTYQIHLFLAFLALVSAIILGVFASPILFSLLIVFPVFLLLGIRDLKKTKEPKESDEALGKAIEFASAAANRTVTSSELSSVLSELKAEALARERERERLAEIAQKNEDEAKSLVEDYTAFLSNFEFESADPFAELRTHLASYRALLEQTALLSRQAELYAAEHKLSNSAYLREDISPEASLMQNISDVEVELRQLRSKKYAAEGQLSTLYDDISKEDELKEKKLELNDNLADAEFTHGIILKAAEHLTLAKERLTARYLGKMREAFKSYITSMASEDEKAFTIDTDFSLRKTEHGLTNPIANYSLGTKELYSLATRLALVDALYEKNSPFVVLDDPFSHFDDEKCALAMSAVKKISLKKQIIYFTCAESRTPS